MRRPVASCTTLRLLSANTNAARHLFPALLVRSVNATALPRAWRPAAAEAQRMPDSLCARAVGQQQPLLCRPRQQQRRRRPQVQVGAK
jgi:hypothetical protein